MDNALALPSLSMLNHTQPGSQRCHLVSNAQGHFCQPGAAWHAPCHQGEYQPSLGSDTCLLCLPGFHCPHPSTRLCRLCPVHAYCPGGMPRSFQLPCLPGAVLSPQYPICLSLIHSNSLEGSLHSRHCTCPGTTHAQSMHPNLAVPLPVPQASLLSLTLLLFFSSAVDLPWLMPCLFPAALQGEHLGQRCGQTGVSTCAALGQPPESGSLSAARRRALGGVSTLGKQDPTD